MRYDPARQPDPARWLALSEDERLDAILRYHRTLPNPLRGRRKHLHATFHEVVENQVALGDEMNVAATVARMRVEGLSRHDAIHAVASVLAGFVYNTVRGERAFPTEAYRAALEKLTARAWLEGGLSFDEE